MIVLGREEGRLELGGKKGDDSRKGRGDIRVGREEGILE